MLLSTIVVPERKLLALPTHPQNGKTLAKLREPKRRFAGTASWRVWAGFLVGVGEDEQCV